jgi:hypothetical protein
VAAAYHHNRSGSVLDTPGQIIFHDVSRQESQPFDGVSTWGVHGLHAWKHEVMMSDVVVRCGCGNKKGFLYLGSSAIDADG